MIPEIFITVLTIQLIGCYPQSRKLPEKITFSAPNEINALRPHNHYPRSIQAQPAASNNLEETVKEVEAMIRANPTLPRLTRGEILDLLENITKTDLAENEVKKRDPKAVMVVMPFTPDNIDAHNMEDLFTKAPVTHIIGGRPFKKPGAEAAAIGTPNNFDSYYDQRKLTEKRKKIRGDQYRKPIFSSPQTPSIISTSTPGPTQQSYFVEKSTTNYRRRRPQTQGSQYTSTTHAPPITTYSPKNRRPIRINPSTTEKYPNHRYPNELPKTSTVLPSSGMRVVVPPKLHASINNEDLLMVEDQRKEVFAERDQPVSVKKSPANDVGFYDEDVVPHDNYASPSFELDVPENLKGVVADIQLESAFENQATKQKPSHNYQTVSHEDEELKIKNMLASLGVVLPSQTPTTTTEIPDISNVADNLTPEMKDLLISFGLMPATHPNPVSDSQVLDSYNPVKAEIKPDSYTGFKPLPEDDTSRHEMEELLARFGLGRSARKQKGLPRKNNENVSFDMVPEEYQEVLEDIGLSNRGGKMIRAEALTKTQEKQHVYNPGDTQDTTQEEMKKLDKLLGAIKQLDKLNRAVTDEDLKIIDVANLKDLVASLNADNKIVPLNEQEAPNPAYYDYGLSKNAVKRQENTSSTSADSSNTSMPTSETPTTTERAMTPNIKDLEDSFGGQPETTTETSSPETTTQARRTGFYYLLDWNSFLDIDDQKGKRVNLRLQPTIGDPKRFYSVSVP